MLGLDEMEPILGWYPSTQDSALGWFGFDGEHMNYNSTAFKTAVNAALDLISNTWQGLSEEQRTAFTSVGPWELFLNQEVGAQWDGGWVVPGYAQNATFNWDFVGIPGGNQAMVTDMMMGMNMKILACTGSVLGIGCSLNCAYIAPAIRIGRMKYGSRELRSVIQPRKGACRISTLSSSTQ